MYPRQQIIQEKSFLRRVYEKWYQTLVNSIPERSGTVVGIGSGAGFFKNYFPGVFLIFLIYTISQSKIIKIMLNSSLICGKHLPEFLGI
jgi:hypothetical protein